MLHALFTLLVCKHFKYLLLLKILKLEFKVLKTMKMLTLNLSKFLEHTMFKIIRLVLNMETGKP